LTLVVSTSGDCPATVTVSSTPPTGSVMVMLRVFPT
jgi:hypothetical protein